VTIILLHKNSLFRPQQKLCETKRPSLVKLSRNTSRNSNSGRNVDSLVQWLNL